MVWDECSFTLLNLSPTVKAYFGGVFLFIAVLGSIENFLVLLVIYRYKQLQTISNTILASLAISDFMAAASVAPLFGLQLLNVNFHERCGIETIRRYLSTFLIGASVFNLGLVSYDRYLHLTELKNYSMTRFKVRVFIFICWFIPFALPYLRFVGETEFTYSVALMVFLTVVFGIILLCYILIVCAIWKHSKVRMDSERARRKHMRAATTVIIIIICFSFMVLPITHYQIVTIVHFVREIPFNVHNHSYDYVIEMMLCLMNTVVNPIIYYYRTPNLQKYLKRFLRFTKFEQHSFNDSRNMTAKQKMAVTPV